MNAIEVTNQQSALPVDAARLVSAVEAVLADAATVSATVSVAVVDDPTIHRLNRRYLDHDDATDVLSFVLEQSERRLEGEVIVSAERALAVASEYGWPPEDELLLYVIHGALHLVGYDDSTPGRRAVMRRHERACLARFGLEASYRKRPFSAATEPGQDQEGDP